MNIRQLSELLAKFDPDKLIAAQVIAEDGTVWNCFHDWNDIPETDLIQLKIWHPELKTLPTGD